MPRSNPDTSLEPSRSRAAPRLLLMLALAASFHAGAGLAPDCSAAQAAEDPAPVPTDPVREKAALALAAQVKSEAAKHSDALARDAISRLAAIFEDPAVSENAKKAVVDALARYMKDFDRSSIVGTALDALAAAPRGDAARVVIETLGRALGAKDVPADVVAASFRALKRIADPSKPTVDALLGYTRYKDYEVVASTCDAIAGYGAAPGAVRKRLFEELVKTFEGIYNGSTSDDVNRKKWSVAGPNVTAALNALSGVSHANPAAARQWFNENKKNADVWK